MATQKIIIFGGAFNPPTLAHEAIIGACLNLPGFDAVWMMPSGDRLDKHIQISDSDRLALCQLVHAARFNNDPRLLVTDFELQLPRPTQTYHTVHALQEAHPSTDFWAVFGSDSYRSMPTWEEGKMLRRLPIILVHRAGETTIAPDHGITLALSPELAQMSSTTVRERISKGHAIDDLVSEPVLEYIASHKLYIS